MKRDREMPCRPDDEKLKRAAQRLFERFRFRLSWITLEDVVQDLLTESLTKPYQSISRLSLCVRDKYVLLCLNTHPVDPLLTEHDTEKEALRGAFWDDVLRALRLGRNDRPSDGDPAMRRFQQIEGNLREGRALREIPEDPVSPARAHQIFHKGIADLKSNHRKRSLRDYLGLWD